MMVSLRIYIFDAKWRFSLYHWKCNECKTKHFFTWRIPVKKMWSELNPKWEDEYSFAYWIMCMSCYMDCPEMKGRLN